VRLPHVAVSAQIKSLRETACLTVTGTSFVGQTGPFIQRVEWVPPTRVSRRAGNYRKGVKKLGASKRWWIQLLTPWMFSFQTLVDYSAVHLKHVYCPSNFNAQCYSVYFVLLTVNFHWQQRPETTKLTRCQSNITYKIGKVCSLGEQWNSRLFSRHTTGGDVRWLLPWKRSLKGSVELHHSYSKVITKITIASQATILFTDTFGDSVTRGNRCEPTMIPVPIVAQQ
jgi:hypothetical protein